MFWSDICAVELLQSKALFDSIILKHLTLGLSIYLNIYVLERVITIVDPCRFESDCIGTIFNLFSFLLTLFIYVLDRVIY
jgi:hypothetical protein